MDKFRYVEEYKETWIYHTKSDWKNLDDTMQLCIEPVEMDHQ